MPLPPLQGSDSVEITADVSWGADQLFGLLVARHLRPSGEQGPQVAMTMPILVGTDGVRRIGEAWGTHRRGQVGRGPVRQGDERSRRADAAIVTLLTDLPRKTSSRFWPRSEPARRQGSDRPGHRSQCHGPTPPTAPAGCAPASGTIPTTSRMSRLRRQARRRGAIPAPLLIKELGLERPPRTPAG